MTINRSTAPAAMVAFFKTLLGTPYSEGSPPGSDADGHTWVPGEGKPNHLDCSGASYYVVRETTGLNIDTGNIGNANGQWQTALGGRVNGNPAPGDLLFFLGAGPPPVGHVGMCVSFDPSTGAGEYISAYDTAEGCIISPFSIHGGADHYVGATRPANALPPAPAPVQPPKQIPEKEDPLAHVYAVDHGMVQIDKAEAILAATNHPHINWYTWNGKTMIGHAPATVPDGTFIYGFANVLDAAGIPHAGGLVLVILGALGANDIVALTGAGVLLMAISAAIGRYTSRTLKDRADDREVYKATLEIVWGTPELVINGQKIREKVDGMVDVMKQVVTNQTEHTRLLASLGETERRLQDEIAAVSRHTAAQYAEIAGMFARTGPTGAPGPKGETGETGATGPKGGGGG